MLVVGGVVVVVEDVVVVVGAAVVVVGGAVVVVDRVVGETTGLGVDISVSDVVDDDGALSVEVLGRAGRISSSSGCILSLST